jgi:hypothetical protein
MVVLSDKTSRFHPRHVVLKPTQADEFEMPVVDKPPAPFTFRPISTSPRMAFERVTS